MGASSFSFALLFRGISQWRRGRIRAEKGGNAVKGWTKEGKGKAAAAMVRWGTRFFGGAVLSCAAVFGGRAPFALGLLAAAGARFDGLFAACGAILGGALFMEFPQRIRFVAAVVLIFSASMAFYDAAFYKKRRNRALVAAGVTAAVEFVYLFAGDPTGKEVLECFAAVALTGAGCALYTDLLKGGSHTSAQMGRFFAATSLLLCGADFTVFGSYRFGRAGALLRPALRCGAGRCSRICSRCAAGCCHGRREPCDHCAFYSFWSWKRISGPPEPHSHLRGDFCGIALLHSAICGGIRRGTAGRNCGGICSLLLSAPKRGEG